MASLEENKAVVRQAYEEAWNKRNLDALDNLLPLDYAISGATGEESGRDVIKGVIRRYHAAFPDLHVEIEDLIAEGDKVVMRGRWSGTHEGEMETSYGMAKPTLKRIEWVGTHIFRVRDGRIAEAIYNTDFLSLYQQLGIIPTPQS